MSQPSQSWLTRRRFLAGVLAVPVLATLYAWRIEPAWVEFTERDLPIAGLPAALGGKRLVQLSDIHIGPEVDDDYIADTFRRVTALQPDLVVHTGDLVTYHGPPTLEQARALLAHWPQGRLGTIAILGNHDYGRRATDPTVAHRIAGLLTAAGCTVLRNEAVEVQGLTIIGLDDLWAKRISAGTLFTSLAPTQPTLALCHNPDACDLPLWTGYQGWILAGHTHGGQCKLPFLPPPFLPVRNRRYTAGEFALDGGRTLYINRGIGHLLRARFNVRPEVTVFRLTPA